MLNIVTSPLRQIYYRIFWGTPFKKCFYLDFLRLFFWLYPRFSFIYLKNCLKGNEDRKNKGRRSKKYICVQLDPSEGVGLQLFSWIAAKEISRRHGLTFVHRGFAYDPHSPECNWDNFFGFGEGEIQYGEITKEPNLQMIELPRLNFYYLKRAQKILLDFIVHKAYPNYEKVMFMMGYNTVLSNPSVYQLLSERYFRRREISPIQSPFRERAVKIVLHIRRGDILWIKEHGRLREILGVDYYQRVLNKVQTILKDYDLDVHLYTNVRQDKALSDYANQEGIMLHFADESADSGYQAFHAMATADILVVGRSTFSYHAGMISRGIKIMSPDTFSELLPPKNKLWMESDSQTKEFDADLFGRVFREYWDKSAH
ncbi:MAG: hypothetical protein JW893_07515 [Candidatus Omnitrophica bacterium]|nr:hypothetical protein [Candidatus Omnitrophota bacterium]